MGQMDNPGISGLVKEMAKLRDEIDKHKRIASTLTQEYDRLKHEAREVMNSNDFQTLKIDHEEGKTVTAYLTTMITTKVEDEASFEEWIQEQKDYDPQFFKQWSPSRIKAMVREKMEIEDEPLPRGVKVTEYQDVRLRRE